MTTVMLLHYLGYDISVICEALRSIVGEQYEVIDETDNDPYENRGVIHCPKDIILDRYNAYHRQAVGLKKK